MNSISALCGKAVGLTSPIYAIGEVRPTLELSLLPYTRQGEADGVCFAQNRVMTYHRLPPPSGTRSPADPMAPNPTAAGLSGPRRPPRPRVILLPTPKAFPRFEAYRRRLETQ